jgi:ABC-type phosphate transport system permease subunit
MLEFLVTVLLSVVVAYLLGRAIGIPAIVIALFGSVYLAARAQVVFDIHSVWLSVPLLLAALVLLALPTILGAGNGAFDQKTPA